jgi:hypothetical protein
VCADAWLLLLLLLLLSVLQAMCASLMTYQASHHPGAMHRKPRLLHVRGRDPPWGLLTVYCAGSCQPHAKVTY